MGLPRIIMPDRNVDIPEEVHRIEIRYPDARIYNVAVSGASEVLTLRSEVVAEVEWQMMQFPNAADYDLHRQLQAWWRHALQGGVWSFARDRNKIVHTTLSVAAVAGASSVVVTSATGIVAGQQYLIRNDVRSQLVEVASIASAPTITLTENLLFAFDAGAIFRDEYYLFGEVIDAEEAPIQKVMPDHYNVLLRFRESRN